MAGAKPLNLFERLRGKRMSDIELPNESGQVDPRLKGSNVKEALEKAGKNFKDLQKNAVMRGLYDAADGKTK